MGNSKRQPRVIAQAAQHHTIDTATYSQQKLLSVKRYIFLLKKPDELIDQKK
jgi:hypothetical protein